MKVIELIEQLKKHDLDAEIIVFDTYYNVTTDIKNLEAATPDQHDETPYLYIMTR